MFCFRYLTNNTSYCWNVNIRLINELLLIGTQNSCHNLVFPLNISVLQHINSVAKLFDFYFIWEKEKPCSARTRLPKMNKLFTLFYKNSF